jgi:subtilisin family serine protease
VAEAHKRPAVINQSQGDNLGAHDGTSLLEQGIDNMLGGPGRAMVKSAGNEASLRRHASGTVAPGAIQVLALQIPGQRGYPLVIDIWYAASDRFDVSVRPPNGPQSNVIGPGQQDEFVLPNGNSVFVDSTVGDPANGDNRIFVVLEASPGGVIEPGGWALTLSGSQVESGRWDAWIQKGEPSAMFLPPLVNPARTISIPGTATEVITVGSYVSRGTGVGAISSFSSLGPTRDGRQAPTLAAPGEQVMAPQPAATGDLYGLSRGTSMAAPMVTGTVALLFQRNPQLTQADLTAALASSAHDDDSTQETPNYAWGDGKLDTKAAFDAIDAGAAAVADEALGTTGANDTAYWRGDVGYEAG